MSEYIKRQQVFDALSIVTKDKQISLYGAVADFIVLVSKIPAADVAPVVHAKWNKDGRCTNCGGHAPYYRQSGAEGIIGAEYYESPYCNECGARMDG